MPISDANVEKIVNDAITFNNDLRSNKTVRQVIKEAQQLVNERRKQGDCGVDIAAAEHYLFCRYVVSLGGLGGTIPLLRPHMIYLLLMTTKGGYDGLKVLGISYQENSCPASPVSADDWRWAREGARDGLDDSYGRYSRAELRSRNRYYYEKYMDELRRLGN